MTAVSTALTPVEAVVLAAVQSRGRNARIIANDTGIPADTVDRIASDLAERGLMNWICDFGDGDARYSPTTPGRDAVRALANWKDLPMSISTVPARFAASILDRQPLSIDAADRGSRNVKLRWQIGSNPDGGIVYAELTASHSPRAKQFYATVNRVTLEPPRDGSPLRTETYWPMDNVRLPVTAPAARYSAAKLRLFVADAIVALSREVEADADRKLLRHFRPAGVA